MDESELSLADIARQSKSSPTLVICKADLLEFAGVVSSHHQGRNRLNSVCAAEPLLDILNDLDFHFYGALNIIQEKLKGVTVTMLAFIYGSWASRYLRKTGRIPNDVDLLIVGGAVSFEIYSAVDKATRRKEKEVTPPILLARNPGLTLKGSS